MDTSMTARIAALRKMTVAELQAQWTRLYGEESRSRNREFLFRRLAWRLQELQDGGLSDRAQERLRELEPDGFARARTPAITPAPVEAQIGPRHAPRRDPRLPVAGSVIVRSYRGRELRLVVLDDGFELDGIRYGSLSGAARAVTGQRWNGPLFWGRAQRKRSGRARKTKETERATD